MTAQEWLNRREHGAGIVELQLGNGPSNALSAPFLDALAAQVTALDQEEAVEVILLGSPFHDFSTGTGAEQNTADFMQALDHALIAIFACKTPIMAVVNGDIHGPGLSLILACDTRIGVAKSGYSFNGVETALELSAAEIVLIKNTLESHVVRRMFLTGQTIGPVAARNYGIIDIVAEDQEDLWMYALREAKALCAISPENYARTKTKVRAQTLETMRAACG
ncbi:enoyl-CoA hydratase/isomerase family protein [Epibacterium ulvae]|uniref:enoyl-CoA hydratase/isomerase family protein n=1 Tax=Epibacterium ulvae TaxID=1156985 RepID=UPI001BFC6F83|nr:enoyl-CoA hydratase/isomerase family protein [Epibacterium ulvae]MBT8154432.1 enoyl-CoA hydratase/isomerase family protein [Epibacterium ulvae]